MNVFISWSGTLSRDVATLLRQYLPCMLQGLNIFMSQHDIESGDRWGVRLTEELGRSGFGIICLTPDNIMSPWLLFEAGAIAKHAESRACGLLLSTLKPAAVPAPLSQFQHRTFDPSDFRRLLSDLNTHMHVSLTEQQTQMVFERWWPEIKSAYDAIITRSGRGETPVQTRKDRDILEEVLLVVRETRHTVYSIVRPSFATTPNVSEFQRQTWNSLDDIQKRILFCLYRQGRESEELCTNPTDEERAALSGLERLGLVGWLGPRCMIANQLILQHVRLQSETDYSIPG